MSVLAMSPRKDNGASPRHLSIVVEETNSLLKTEDDVDTAASTAKAAIRVVHLVRYIVLLLGNIVAWYVTNGMNGIALQSFAAQVREYRAGNEDLASNMGIMALITTVQLGFGALVGLSMMWVLSLLQPSSHKGRRFQASMSKEEVVLGSLHSIGSISTNLGFMYGSASLVQILKLLEPFETLFLSQLLIPDEGRFTIGVVSSMILVVGSAVSLIRIRPTKPHPHAVLFAIFSGITLSSRNVLQRKQHVQANVDVNHGHDDSNKSISKVERSIDQFTTLSFQSAVMTGIAAVLLNGFLFATTATHAAAVNMVLSEALNWRVLTWHPLYNTFSMITLGFCSALTHSLLNAGKRVFAIVMAIVWFGEDFNVATLMGLLAVACGGCWYTMEVKAKKSTHPPTKWARWFKLVVALGLLQILLQFQSSSKE